MRLSIQAVAIIIVAVVATTSGHAQEPTRQSWGALERLQGTWIVDSGSGGRPGTAIRGGEAWTMELAGRVLVRRDFSEYPAVGGRPASRHDGLMVVAPSPAGGFEASYYDSEGHVIHYDVVVHDTALVFTSPPTPGLPQFRLRYRPTARGYDVHFDIAAPNAPSEFRTYVEGGLHRAP